MLHRNDFEPIEDALPPQEVRITGLRAEPWPENGRKVRVHLDVTPFLERPNMEMIITDSEGAYVSRINIIESIDARVTFTMHIRGENLKNPYTLAATVTYSEVGTVDQKSISFETQENAE
jgi:hypothetical protein